VHGPSLVLKTTYNNSGKGAGVAVDEILYRCGVNNVANRSILGFYLGKLLPFAAVVSGLLSEEGLEVDSVKYTFKLIFGNELGYVVC
jgi:hypothetical protein